MFSKYLAETVNPDLRRRGVPLVWSTRPSEGDGVQLCLNVIEDPTKPNRGVLPFKKNTETHADIPGMEKKYPIVGGGIHCYSQYPSADTLNIYYLRISNNIHMSYDTAYVSYSSAWAKVGLPREKLCRILDDIFECVSHYRANPTEASLFKRTKLGIQLVKAKDQMQREIVENKLTVIAQNQARPEIIRIVEHYNQDMVKNSIPVRFVALDFGEPGGRGNKGIGGHNLGIFVPADIFSKDEDCLRIQLPLTKEAWLLKLK